MINHPSLWASVFLDTQIDAQATETYQIRSWNIQKKVWKVRPNEIQFH